MIAAPLLSQPDPTAQRVRLADYRPPAILVTQLLLEIELAVPRTRVRARLRFECSGAAPVRFDGVGLQLQTIAIDGVPLSAHEYLVDDNSLTLFDPPPCGELVTTVDVDVTASAAEGILQLDDALVTNCEPEGFRRITFFPDRPDVLCRMGVTLSASEREYPTLLANGNLLERGRLPDGRHYARWQDPLPKASYLFALVAGRFSRVEDEFVTASGRRVQLAVHARTEDLPYCQHGLASLRKAMAWDERMYGREFDLDALNVAVMRSYPGGAMECKGLNLYATEFFLASAAISTDEDLVRVAGVVGHEYFHNWSGNRVGCRDWFQLSLKEGLTVFRQQQFVAALSGEASARIDDVARLRELQYPEDEGGMAHAVQPQSYLAISNFYTRTVYEKGAELIRMMGLIVGHEQLIAAIRTFFDEHDGRATTIEALMGTIERVGAADLQQFRQWYDVVGRPRIEMRDEYDARTRRYALTFTQCVAPAMHIPMKVGLLSREGRPLQFRLDPAAPPLSECLIELREPRQTLVLTDVESHPVPSLLRGFSAPVDIAHSLDDAALATLAMHDTDSFNRHESARQLAVRTLHRLARTPGDGAEAEPWLAIVEYLLATWRSEPALIGRALRLPSLQDLIHGSPRFDLDALSAARISLRREVARRSGAHLRELRVQLSATSGIDPCDRRRLSNRCLWYLAGESDDTLLAECRSQLRTASTMEDQSFALQLLVDAGGVARDAALEEFKARWWQLPAAFDHWFRVQGASEAADCADRIAALVECPDFSFDAATRIKATFDAFTGNLAAFHRRDGHGYAVVEKVVLTLSERNARLAARFLKRFDGWHRYDSTRRVRVQHTLQRVLATPAIAPELQEIASESLRRGRAACVEQEPPSP